MSRQFTIEQVTAHNLNENNPENNWYVVIHGEVYRVGSIPFKKCPINAAVIVAKLLHGPDASDLFVTEHMDGKTVDALKSARRCHVGTIVTAPAGGQQGPPAHHAQQETPGQQEQNANHGQHGQNDGHVQNEQNRQQNDDDHDDGWTGAERRRREEARKRRLRKAYNPLKQDPDDVDEYPADAVAMGYLPDLDGRRWRERRMRLSRFIQYNDSPAVEEEDLDPIATSLLDMDFAKEIWYKRNLKGGEAKRCTGSFQAARPPPPRSQLRPRPGTADPSGGHHHHHHHQPPQPRDLPDSDADDDDSDDDNAPGAPAVRARVQLEARVREWFPSNSNRTVLHLATPPITPQTNPAQPNVRPPIQPPAPPPQHSQQRSREEEEEISKQRQAREDAELQEVLRKQQKNQADKPEATGTGLETPQSTQQPTETGGKRIRKVTDEEREKQSAQRRDEARRKDQEKRRKQKEEEDELKRQDAEKKREEDAKKKREEDAKKKREEDAKKKREEDAKKKREEDAKKKREEDAKKKREEDAKKKREEDAKKKQKEDDELKRQKEQEEAQKKDAAKRANEEPGKNLEGQTLEDARNQMEKVMREKAEEADRVIRENREREERELQKAKDSQAALEEQFRTAQQEFTAQQETFTAQQARIRNFIEMGYTLEKARRVVDALEGGLVEDPNKKVRKSPWPAHPKWSPIKFMDPLELTSPKRPAETTQEDQGPNKKPRKDETQQDKKGQAGGSSSSGSSKFGNKSRPWKEGEEPWTKPAGAGQNIGFGAGDLLDDDEDWDESADELAAPGVTTGTQPSTGGGGAAPTPRRDVPSLPSDVPPPGNTTTGASHTPQNVPAQSQGYGTVPPATGWPTAGTTPSTAGTAKPPAPNTNTRSSRSGRRRRPGLAPGAQIPDDVKKLMKEHARKK